MDVTSGRHLGRLTNGSIVRNTQVGRSIIGRDKNVDLWEKCLLILGGRELDRECLAKAFLGHNIGMDVLALSSVEEWRKQEAMHPPLGAILLNLGGQKATEGDAAEDIARLASDFGPVPVVILADAEEPQQILKVLECGARGYIPSSVGIEVCVEATCLAAAGGIFVPASAFLAMRYQIQARANRQSLNEMFTFRQAEVARALRRGKANKIIARELHLRESTVKVHIGNIMKKLKATNRTEVACRINDLFPSESDFYRSAE